MEVVTYKKHKVYLDTIPKGTLLFRVTATPKDDFIGVDVGNETCIPPQYNVFFYLDPFVSIILEKWFVGIENIEVYELEADVKVVLLLKPSPHSRGDAKTKSRKTFMVPCNKTRKACLKGRTYDPCFEEDFLKKFPNVVGYIGLSRKDSSILQTKLKTSLKDVIDYIPVAEDSRGVEGPPELVLYPLQKRSLDDILVDDPKEWKATEDFNYKHVTSIPRTKQELIKFIDNHTSRDPNTGYYTHNL
jgi:hypothetical protein